MITVILICLSVLIVGEITYAMNLQNKIGDLTDLVAKYRAQDDRYFVHFAECSKIASDDIAALKQRLEDKC